MIIRSFCLQDRASCGELFYQTIHTVCSNDYSNQQLDIWAPEVSRSGDFPRPLENNDCFVAVFDEEIIGFADITKDGYLDRFFVHKDYQGKGMGKRLLSAIEQRALERGLKTITIEASITARPFFEKMGYEMIQKQQKIVKDVAFENFKMKKSF
jgi:putative acetyltransferase